MFHDTMTPFERIMSLRQTGAADRPGVSPSAAGIISKMVHGLTLGEMYIDPVKFAKGYLYVQQMFGFDGGPMFGHGSLGVAEFGGKIAYPAPNSRAQCPFIVERPIHSLEDVDRIEVPDPRTAGEIPKEVEAARYVLKNYPPELRSASIATGTNFTMTGNIIGVERMLLWMIREPGAVHRMQKKVADYEVELVKHCLKELGPMMFYDGGPVDSNDLIDPKQFEEFALRHMTDFRLRALAAGAPGFMTHPCGDQRENMELWLRAPGSFAMLFDYRSPLSDLVKKIAPRMMIIGNIEPAHFINHDYDSIYKISWECLHTAATHCPLGYMIAPGCEIPVDTPATNLFAMIKATKDYAETAEWKAHVKK